MIPFISCRAFTCANIFTNCCAGIMAGLLTIT